MRRRRSHITGGEGTPFRQRVFGCRLHSFFMESATLAAATFMRRAVWLPTSRARPFGSWSGRTNCAFGFGAVRVRQFRYAHHCWSAHGRRDVFGCPGRDRRELCPSQRGARNRGRVASQWLGGASVVGRRARRGGSRAGGDRSPDCLPPIDARRTVSHWTERFPVIDLIYVLATLAFFGLMVAYVRACEHLGHAPSDDHKSGEEIP
jgi:hypothetical protein